MKISVVIPVYNAEKTIRPCMESISAQERVPDQVILVDNGSIDKSVSIIEDFIARHKELRMQLLHEAKKGAAAARNKSLSCLEGDIVAFTDSDCILRSDWVKNLVSLYERDTADAISGMTFLHDPRGVSQKLEALDLFIPDSLRGATVKARHEILFGKILATFNASCKREVFIKAGGFDEALSVAGEDVDFTIRVYDLGYRIMVWHPEAVVWHMPRRSYHLFVKKIFQYRSVLPVLLKKHFNGLLFFELPGRRVLQFPFFSAVLLRREFTAYALCGLSVLVFFKYALFIAAAALGIIVLNILRSLIERGIALGLKISLPELGVMVLEDICKKIAAEFAKVYSGIKTRAFYL